MQNDIFCFIPAKGASTRLKEKNILPIMGKEMIGYAIEAAIDSEIFSQNDVIVSTESDRVANVSKKFGATLSKRDPKLAVDPYGVVDVLLDFFSNNSKYKSYKYVMILLPTTPTINDNDLISAYDNFIEANNPCLMSINETRNNAFTSIVIDDKGLVTPIFPDKVKNKSQELPATYDLNAAITILKIEDFLKEKSYFLSPMSSYILDMKKAVDVDTHADFNYAKFLMETNDTFNYIIDKEASIRDALLQLGENRSVFETLYILENDVLLGSLSYGDINSYIDENNSLDEKIVTIINKNPMKFYQNDSIDVENILKNKNIRIYRFIPIINRQNNKVINFIDILNINKLPNKVVLMVGGLGNRLRPLTENIPKPMLKVGNKPILHTILEQFKENSFNNFIFCTNYKSEIVQKYFKDGKEFDVDITYILEEKRLGTAGALSLIDTKFEDPFFVMNGDILTDVNFNSMLSFHNQNKNVATMCVVEHQIQIPYGVIESKNNQILDIVEKPTKKYLVNAGIYLLNPSILDLIPKNEFYDMPTLFNELIKKNKKTGVFTIEDYWLDIGHHDDFIQANAEYDKYFGDIN